MKTVFELPIISGSLRLYGCSNDNAVYILYFVSYLRVELHVHRLWCKVSHTLAYQEGVQPPTPPRNAEVLENLS
jgi:hypothetical protein